MKTSILPTGGVNYPGKKNIPAPPRTFKPLATERPYPLYSKCAPSLFQLNMAIRSVIYFAAKQTTTGNRPYTDFIALCWKYAPASRAANPVTAATGSMAQDLRIAGTGRTEFITRQTVSAVFYAENHSIIFLNPFNNAFQATACL